MARSLPIAAIDVGPDASIMPTNLFLFRPRLVFSSTAAFDHVPVRLWWIWRKSVRFFYNAFAKLDSGEDNLLSQERMVAMEHYLQRLKNLALAFIRIYRSNTDTDKHPAHRTEYGSGG